MSSADENDFVESDFDPNDVVEFEIDGVLDLHTFSPKDVKFLVPDYLVECKKRKIYSVRIIHGKGTGALRDTVHAILKRSPLVQSFKLAEGGSGGWGATVVELKE